MDRISMAVDKEVFTVHWTNYSQWVAVELLPKFRKRKQFATNEKKIDGKTDRRNVIRQRRNCTGDLIGFQDTQIILSNAQINYIRLTGQPF
jgi:hypothetical protein